MTPIDYADNIFNFVTDRGDHTAVERITAWPIDGEPAHMTGHLDTVVVRFSDGRQLDMHIGQDRELLLIPDEGMEIELGEYSDDPGGLCRVVRMVRA